MNRPIVDRLVAFLQMYSESDWNLSESYSQFIEFSPGGTNNPHCQSQ